MSDDAGQVQRLERALARAWPAAEVAHIDGWELRATAGHSRRANSVNPFPPHPPPSAIDECERWYRSRRLRPIFRLTPASDPDGLDRRLAALGYREDAGTWVMAGPIPDGEPVDAMATPGDAWLAARNVWAPLPQGFQAAWEGILSRMPAGAAGFGLAMTPAGDPAALGHAVVDGDLVGLYGLLVDPGLRRQGYGEHLSRGLMAWGRSQGATTAYLQVHEPSSAAAMSLYEAKLGLQRIYEYRYREAPTI